MNLVTGNNSFYWQTPEGTANQHAAEHPPRTARDTYIISDFLEGMKIKYLAAKYHLSEVRIRQIINGKDEL